MTLSHTCLVFFVARFDPSSSLTVSHIASVREDGRLVPALLMIGTQWKDRAPYNNRDDCCDLWWIRSVRHSPVGYRNVPQKLCEETKRCLHHIGAFPLCVR
ncbi:hypothetical protein OE88DRAFT_1658545 [Heliocybe sulcata]|uniref:Uncharacterized protein n=1 Tax=Heliocybe sulcata TaxID=5364 RepID=A0A5C3N3E9_9AGAM|nr:hypothetical protein OE88DRAFT_1658545 [Heliocybe sulcata]